VKKIVFKNKEEMGKAVAASAAEKISRAIENKGEANIILATGTSQFETLKPLVSYEEIDWSKVRMFHLDEYIGLGEEHPASFRKYLKERFVEQVRTLKAVHFIDGDAEDLQAECRRLGEIITACPIDVALVGIGENGHLAFNDPPADFETQEPFIIVKLNETCRKQQLGEGWFETIDDVPKSAVSMSVRQIMKSDCIIASVSQRRKAQAVKSAIEGNVSNMCPASILQEHPNCEVYLDEEAASELST
jgi:glucosamine-6-phosphate deaminase